MDTTLQRDSKDNMLHLIHLMYYSNGDNSS